MSDNNDIGIKVGRFFLTWCLGFLGSFIINVAGLAPEGYKSRTKAYLFLGFVTCGIYSLVAAICNFTFDPSKSKNIGYYKA